MKKILTAILVFTMLLTLLPLGAVGVSAATTGDFTYSTGNGQAWITGYTGSDASVVVPSELGGYPVVSISEYAFENVDTLVSITIPDGVTTIGQYAFCHCDNLQILHWPDSITEIGVGALNKTAYEKNEENWTEGVLYVGKHLIKAGSALQGDCTVKKGTLTIADSAFRVCTKLTSISLPNSLVAIGKEAFSGCNKLTSIVIPANVTTIGNFAFYSCRRLETITVASSNPNYRSVRGVLFNKDKTTILQYPSGKTDSSYQIPDTVTYIGSGCFSNCSYLLSVAIPDGVIFIGENAFYGCVDMASLVIPDSVSVIDAYAFSYCKDLTAITIPDSVVSLGYFAFAHCQNLKEVKIGKNVTVVDTGTFSNCENLVAVDIPENVTKIAYKAFFGCTALIEIVMPDSVTTIETYAFRDCTNLTTITFGDNVTQIGEYAFDKCDALKAVHYNGDADDLKNIAIDNKGNTALVLAEWHYFSTACDESCSQCGYTRQAAAHTYDSGKVTKVATCKATGVKTYTCTECKATKTESIAKTPHAYKKVVTKATLTKNGVVKNVCSKCGYTASKTTAIAKVATIKLSKGSYAYNGKTQKPSVVVKDSKGKTISSKYYTVTYASGRKNVGTYKVTVKFKGNYSGTKTLTFKIIPRAASINKLTAKSKAITVKLNRSLKQSTGYEVQYSTSKSFSSAKTKIVKSYKTSSLSLTGLKVKKTYYVRVRTYKTVNGKKVYSNWSTAKSVKTK